MATTIATIRANVRKDLHDEDANNYRWTDGELDRHISHAVQEFSRHLPLQQKTTLSTSAGSRELSVASLADLLWIEEVEYPTGQFPPSYVRFSLWGTTLTLLGERAPAGVESVNVYWNKIHTLDASTSTLPTWGEDIVAVGAEAYAALEWASYATNRVNVGGEATWKHYLDFGLQRLKEFYEQLRLFGEGRRVRARRLYRLWLPPQSQTTDWGP
jgi:hypothetical protein